MIFGVHLLGLSWQTLHKLFLTLVFFAAALLLRWLLVQGVRLLSGKNRNERVVFWTRQIASILAAIVIGIAFVSIWFEDPAKMAGPLSIITAGVAFALQKVITAFAGYLVILRGKTFSVGDRITMGGVRGDVIALGFFQTTILEMGEPPEVQAQGGAPTWVHSRQHSGRLVTITNDKLFDCPVFNYTREFPFLFEEIRLPIAYGSDRARAERILLEVARDATRDIRERARDHEEVLKEKYFVDVGDMDPRVFYRLTDNWLELTLRFVVAPHGARATKDHMSRAILDRLDQAKIGIASATYDVVGFPPIKIDDGAVRAIADLVRGGAKDGNGRLSAPSMRRG